MKNVLHAERMAMNHRSELPSSGISINEMPRR